MTTAKRFEGRTTIIKGFIINLSEQTQKPFECVTGYTRSNDKAIQYAREALNIGENPMVVIAVTELVNEAPKPIKYNDGKIYDLAYNRFDSEDEANSAAEIDETVVKAITWYEIGAQIWALDTEENYLTEWYADETPMNMTKQNAREFIRMSFADQTGYKVIGVHACEKKEKPMYCVITRENLQLCIDK